MLRTARFKYAVYDRGEHREQLHDLHDDRLEMNNLAAEHAARTDKMAEVWYAWADETGVKYKRAK